MIKFPRPLPLPFRIPAAFTAWPAFTFAAALSLALAPPAAAEAGGSSAASPGAPLSAGASGPASACGLIWLEVDPGPAEVSLDGDFLDAGVWLISVPPGEHDVRIRKTGFRAYAGRVSVQAGASVHLEVRLQPGTAGDS